MDRSRLAVEWVAIARLTNNPANPRVNDDAVPHVAASLRRFGWQQPVVAKRSGEVIAGNTRLKAARSLGMADVPVVWFDGSELDAVAYSIADNKTHEFAHWDDAALATLLKELRDEDSLDGVGFDPAEIDTLLAELDAQAGVDVQDEGPQPPVVDPVTRLGELWRLGDHRLLVGDSTKPDDVARVLAGEQAALLSTDPPYCVDYTGNDRPIHDGKPSGKDWSQVYREVDIADLGTFLDGVFTACLPHVRDDAGIYVWHAHVQQPTIAAAFERHGLLLHQVLVWVKPCATFGHCYYRWKHEPCAFGWKRGHKPVHGVGQLETVWESDWDGKARIASFHPCLHPDAHVLTETGYRAISSITVGDRVLSADGQFHAVSDVSSHPYRSDSLVKIVAKGGNIPTLASDNHPFLIWRPERERRRVVGGNVHWARADEVRVGDYTMTPVLAPEAVEPCPDLDEEFWFLFGFYLAQGSLQKAGHGGDRYPAFALPKKYHDLVGRIRARWDSIGEYDPSDCGYFYERDLTGRPSARITHTEHEGRSYTLRYVKAVERVPYRGDVWNLSVEGCPTFQTAVGMSHNTSKPTRLFEIPIEQHTRRGDVVLEPFCGSGSQLIAAEKLGRRCRAIELQPAFVDGTIARFERATGKPATLESTGQTFEAVRRERKGA